MRHPRTFKLPVAPCQCAGPACQPEWRRHRRDPAPL